jgi:hypothetical protein
VGGNGLYAYNSVSTFPDQSYSGSNYWVDVVFSAAEALMAAEPGASPEPVVVTLESLSPVVEEAVRRWVAAGADPDGLAQIEIRVEDLPATYLGWAFPGVIVLDRDAAGHGWFIDPTPADDSEFDPNNPDSPAAGKIDLLSVLVHEMGHLLGLEHSDDHDVMGETLEVGVRLVPEADHLADEAALPPSSPDQSWADSGLAWASAAEVLTLPAGEEDSSSPDSAAVSSAAFATAALTQFDLLLIDRWESEAAYGGLAWETAEQASDWSAGDASAVLLGGEGDELLIGSSGGDLLIGGMASGPQEWEMQVALVADVTAW